MNTISVEPPNLMEHTGCRFGCDLLYFRLDTTSINEGGMRPGFSVATPKEHSFRWCEENLISIVGEHKSTINVCQLDLRMRPTVDDLIFTLSTTPPYPNGNFPQFTLTMPKGRGPTWCKENHLTINPQRPALTVDLWSELMTAGTLEYKYVSPDEAYYDSLFWKVGIQTTRLCTRFVDPSGNNTTLWDDAGQWNTKEASRILYRWRGYGWCCGLWDIEEGQKRFSGRTRIG